MCEQVFPIHIFSIDFYPYINMDGFFSNLAINDNLLVSVILYIINIFTCLRSRCFGLKFRYSFYIFVNLCHCRLVGGGPRLKL